MKIFVISLLLGCVTVFNLYADVAPDPLFKGINPTGKTATNIQLVSEQVDIYLNGAKKCDFEVSFVLKNPSEVTEKMEVGFPTSYENEIKDLVVTVDGKRINTKFDHQQYSYKMGPTGSEYSKTRHTYWILWNMTFEAKQTKVIKMKYWVIPRDNLHWGTRYKDYKDAIKEDVKLSKQKTPSEVEKVLRAINSCSTGYTLVTGSGWSNKIKKAVINVYFKSKRVGVIRTFRPDKDYKISKDKLTWTFTDFEPDFDIEIEYNYNYTVDEEIKLVEKAISSTNKHCGLLVFLNHLYFLKSNHKKQMAVLKKIVDIAENNEYNRFYSNPLYKAYIELIDLLSRFNLSEFKKMKKRASKHLRVLLKKETHNYSKELIEKTLKSVEEKNFLTH